MKLKPLKKDPLYRCWFCQTDKSVKYEAKITLSPTYGEGVYAHIAVCDKCALLHGQDFLEETE